MKKVIKADLDQFTHEDFNCHYNTLIDVGNVYPEHEHQIMGALGFLNELQRIVENLKEDLEAEPGECEDCKEKSKRIKDLENYIGNEVQKI